ncbi:MAG: endolytic transglycosylase MltG, partial [bacterium]|nr:endolytic transglycosylase MltG [bacterium]
MTPDYQPPRDTSWQVRLIQLFVVAIVILLSFVLLTSIARNLASGISNESTGTILIEEGLEVEVDIAAGSSASAIAAALVEEGVIGDPADFESAVRSQGVADQLKAGEYLLVTGTDTDDLIDILVEGPEPADVYRVTVIEGLGIEEILESLSVQTGYTRTQLEAPLTNGTIDSPYLPKEAPEGYDEIIRWEGLLAPDTYEFRREAGPAEILGAMVDTLATRLSSMDWSVIEEMGLDEYDGLIIASLIEKEVKLDEERPVVASVITNRLEAGIALQIDATIIYALG